MGIKFRPQRRLLANHSLRIHDQAVGDMDVMASNVSEDLVWSSIETDRVVLEAADAWDIEGQAASVATLILFLGFTIEGKVSA